VLVLAIALMGTGSVLTLLSLSPALFADAPATLKAALVSDWVSSVLTVLLLLAAAVVVVVVCVDSAVVLVDNAATGMP
jgi:hypothetical protein